MKRILICILALAMIIALAGCGGQSQENIGGQVTPSTEDSQDAPAAEKELALGNIQGGTYTNTYAGIGCTLDESWTISGADELQQISAAVEEAMTSEELGQALEEYDSFTDMMITNDEKMCNVNVLYQKISPLERLSFLTMSDQDVVDTVLEDSDSVVESYEAMGMENVSMEAVEVQFLGQTRVGLQTACTLSGMEMTMVQLFDYKLGDYAIVVTCTSYGDTDIQQILDLFYAVD